MKRNQDLFFVLLFVFSIFLFLKKDGDSENKKGNVFIVQYAVKEECDDLGTIKRQRRWISYPADRIPVPFFV